jgi:hypothetical protein
MNVMASEKPNLYPPAVATDKAIQYFDLQEKAIAEQSKQTKAIVRATWVMAVATVFMAVPTIIQVIVLLSHR